MGLTKQDGANFLVRIHRKKIKRIIDCYCTPNGVFNVTYFEMYMTEHLPEFFTIISNSKYCDAGSYKQLVELCKK